MHNKPNKETLESFKESETIILKSYKNFEDLLEDEDIEACDKRQE